MAGKPSPNAAQTGHRVVIVSCHGRQLVRESMRGEWTCRTCGGRGLRGDVTLILPAPGEPYEPDA